MNYPSDLLLKEYKIQIDYDSIECKEISDEEYFSSVYKSYVSNSKLKLINPEEEGSLRLYLEGLKPFTTQSLSIGTAVHSQILQPEEFEISNQTKPSGKGGLMVEEIYKQRKNGLTILEAIYKASEIVDYYKSKLSESRIKTLIKSGISYYLYLMKDLKFKKEQIILDSNSKKIAEECINKIKSNTDAMNIINPEAFNYFNHEIINKNEDAMFVKLNIIFPNSDSDILAETVKQSLYIKIKIDNWNIDFTNKVITLNDLKTTGKAVYMFPGSTCNETKEYIPGSWEHYHYYRQMAFYIWVLKLYLKKKYNINIKEYKIYINMIVVSTVPPYSSIVYKVTNEWVEKGYKEFVRLLKYAAFAEYNKDLILGK